MMKRKVIRIHRRDSAFVYAILESLEGMASYSTLDPAADQPDPAHRDLELWFSEDFADDVQMVLDGFRKKFPVIELGE